MVLVLLTVFSAPALASPEPAFPLGRADTRAPGAGGNEMCPVKPDQLANEKFQISFHGKRINFCCPECTVKFEHHPRPAWTRLAQYAPYLAMNWPDPDLDRDRNRVRMNAVYRDAAAAGRWATLAITVLILPLCAIIIVSRIQTVRGSEDAKRKDTAA